MHDKMPAHTDKMQQLSKETPPFTLFERKELQGSIFVAAFDKRNASATPSNSKHARLCYCIINLV